MGKKTIAKDGRAVQVHYKGTFEDGTVFDSSYERGQTIGFTVGAGEMIPGFDAAVKGMKIGETKTVTLTPDEASQVEPKYKETYAAMIRGKGPLKLKKYDNPDAVHHYEVKQTSGDTTKVIEIPSDSANIIPEDAVIVTNYNYAERAEDNKRQIRVIKPEYIPQIKREIHQRIV